MSCTDGFVGCYETNNNIVLNPVLSDWNTWLDGYDNYMQDFGHLELYEASADSVVSDGSLFSMMLLEEAESSASTKIPYHGFYAPPNESYLMVGFNLSALHSKPIARNCMRNWILRTHFNSSASIKVSNYPLKQTEAEQVEISDGLSLFVSMMLFVALTLLPVSTIYQIVYEKTESRTKHQQFVSGMYVFVIYFCFCAVCFVFILYFCFFYFFIFM